MKPAYQICVVAVSVAVFWSERGVQAEDGSLIVADKEIKVTVPVQFQNSLPLQLRSSLSTQYSFDSSAGMLRLGNMVLEQGFQYPPLFGDIYSGNTIGQSLNPFVKDGIPKAGLSSTYLTTWLNKQWASVNLSLLHTHLIDNPGEQLTYGVYKAFSALNNCLFLSVGEYLFNDLGNRYWYRATALSLDYGWKRWNLSMFIQEREDSSTRDQSVWAAIKKSF